MGGGTGGETAVAGNKGFTNRAKSGKFARQARIEQFVRREKTEAKKITRPAPSAKPAAARPKP